MAISDYIPNIFGQQGQMYEGLLSPQDMSGLSQRSNIAGLLGTAAALASGVSRQGPRRSALQNIIGALGAGYGASGQAFQGGIEQMANAQKLAQMKLESQKLAQTQQAINTLINDPRIANDPLKVAYIRSNPNEALKLYSELLPLQEAMAPKAAPSVAPSMAPEAPVAPQMAEGNVLPGQVVTAKPSRESGLVNQRDVLINQIQTFSQPQFLGNSKAEKIIESANKSLETINKQLDRASVESYDFKSMMNTVPPAFKQRVLNLQQLAETGAIGANDLSQRLQSIEKDAIDFVSKKQDYTNQDRRVAAGLFQGKPIEELNPIELMQLENKLYEMRIAEKKAGATNINMPTESERTAGFLTSRLQGSLSQLRAVTGQSPTAASPNIAAEAVKLITGSDYLKNLANPETRQQVEAAQLELLDAALTLGTGAAYTKEQLLNYQKSYFPQLGDKPGAIKDKTDRLNKLLESAQIKAGRSAPTERPAFDIDSAIKQELERRKGKK
jgi:hypothetical protein